MQIHATLGPASLNETTITELYSAGVNVFRLNMSHQNRDQLSDVVKKVRRLTPEIKIGTDIKGRKLRIGTLPGREVLLRKGDNIQLVPVDSDKEFFGESKRFSINYPSMADSLSQETTVLLDDGALTLIVKSVSSKAIECEVVKGGLLPERSGVNIPGHATNLPPLTDKDIADIEVISELSPDFVYFSFVERAEDIKTLRRALSINNLDIPIISKIELLYALHNLDEIVIASDMLCLARGDLGTEIPLQEIPFVQREVVQTAVKHQKPILMAGEVLYSMVNRHIPLRAELTDVVTAVEQGVDGFILSDETAVGVSPVDAVKHLCLLIEETEKRMTEKEKISGSSETI